MEQATLEYCLQRSSRRRSMAILIKDDGRVKVYAPKSVSEEKIRRFLSQKTMWISRHLRRISARPAEFPPSYNDGAEFLFLGRRYPLRVLKTAASRPAITFNEEGWRIDIPHKTDVEDSAIIRSALEAWYRDQAKEFLIGRTLQWARRMQADVREVHVRTQKRLWGCCHPLKKKIHLNWRIILAPVEAVDYVIVHELCHLFVPNHSRKFWNAVGQYDPDYPLQKKWFKDHARELG